MSTDVLSVLVVDCVGSGLCEGLIARLEETYRICVSNCVLYRNLNNERPRPELDCCVTDRKMEAMYE